MTLSAGELFHSAAVRIVAHHLNTSGGRDVRVASEARSLGSGVDIYYVWDGEVRTAKVKADPYCGTDPALVADLSLPFYRADVHSYALETISNAASRAPGWLFASDADEVLYLFLAVACTEEQVAAALAAPDDVFFARLVVERDELFSLPMLALRAWLTSSQEAYPARPVTAGRTASWVRLVPKEDVSASVTGVRAIGSIFPRAQARD